MLDPPRDAVRARIAERFEAMLDDGRRWRKRWRLEDLDPALPAAKLLGLAPASWRWPRAALTRSEALDEAITATRQFAKRQMTWFRHRMADYIWFDPIC